MTKSCANCGKTLSPIDAVLSKFCRQCADKNVRQLSK